VFIKRDNLTTIAEVVERNTGIPTEEFLNPKSEPYVKNLAEMAAFIRQYHEDHPTDTVTIVGDYDSDGINATMILLNSFRGLGFENVKTRLPHRFSEGYGLKDNIIDEIDSGLLVTVDNGIAAHSAIKKAKEKGLTVLVVDHHLPPVDADGNYVLPEADMILDPHIDKESEFSDYCGAGLAFRLAKLLFPERHLYPQLVQAALATVTDVMPLTGDNRNLVKEGLVCINKRRVVPGMKVLLDKLQMDDHITEGDFGFKIGPTFNASGRLYDNGAERVLDLLKCGREDISITFKADALIKTNERRKELVKEAMKTAEEIYDGNRPIVLYHPSFGEGLIGIIAGQMAEKYHCPAIVFTDAGKEGVLKGSGRSIPEINLKTALDRMQDEMLGYGGHAGAAGLSIAKANIMAFTLAFAQACGNIPAKPVDVYYDLVLESMADLQDIIRELAKFAPFGEGNPMPVFLIRGADLSGEYKVLGDGSHFMVKGEPMSFMGFDLTEKYEKAGKPQKVNCVGYVRDSWFRGKQSFKFEMLDFEAV